MKWQGGPSARSCHKMCLDATNKQMFLLGRYLEPSLRTPEALRVCIVLILAKKIKASHTRYWALGPELIPEQAVSPQVTISHPLGGRLPLLFARPAITCQPQSITAAWPVQSYTAWWQRQDCRTFCTISSDCCRHLSITYVVNDISSYCLLKCIVSSSWWLVELRSSWHCLRLRCCQWEDDRCVQVHLVILTPVNPPNSLIRQNCTERIHSHLKTTHVSASLQSAIRQNVFNSNLLI